MVGLLYIGCIGFDYTKYKIKNSAKKAKITTWTVEKTISV